MGLRRAQRLDRFRHRLNVRRRRPAAAAQNAHSERRRFAGKAREILRRRFRIHDAVAFSLWEACVGHAARSNVVHRRKLLQNREQRLRTQRAIRANHLHIFVFQLRGRVRRPNIAMRGAFFRIGQLRHDGQAGK